MDRKRPGRNDPCHCGSGLKYKKCHEGMEEGRFPFRLPGSPGVWVNEVKVEASVVEAEASPMPCWLLALARDVATAAQSNYDALTALLLVTTAGEAVLNRLLEPLVPEAEWEDFERQRVADKWKRLGREVGLTPALDAGQPPLSVFLRTVAVRNALVHFKHGQSLRVKQQPIAASWAKGTATLHLDNADGAPTEKIPTIDWHDTLDPKNAPAGYLALRDLLVPILDRYPFGEFRIADELKIVVADHRPDQDGRPANG
jgi:hypothetical protein